MNNDEQLRTPLFDAMVQLAESKKISFHTPGHKSGKGISTRFRKFVGNKIFSIDLTTLDEIDSLQKPKGVIKEAQALAARAYGADRSYFLVNGTSVGNHAMVLTACDPGSKVIVTRNAHKSVIAGLILIGAEPVFVKPKIDGQLKLTLNAAFDDIKDAIESNPETKTLFLTTPNYYGVCVDLKKIIAYAHEKGIAVLIDEAHGPHLKFHKDLPISALEAGADMCVQSTHKIIGGMTQASMLHARRERVDIDILTNILKLVQTTSPSYILMASLDLARMQMATEGEKLLSKTIKLAEEARTKINKIQGISCFGKEIINKYGLGDLDITKLTITVKDIGLTGYQVSQLLNTKYDIQVEMADPYHILVIVSIGDRRDDLKRLVAALEDIAATENQLKLTDIDEIKLPLFENKPAMSPREAFFAKNRFINVRESAGKICSEIITVYPPGIPVLIPGEIISEEIVDYLNKMIELGGTIDGMNEDNTLIGVVDR
ncbi:MAG: aminotransferase class I/II-fold pyridoxal phosphate-dependent enzyme [Nitrospirota bacterium]